MPLFGSKKNKSEIPPVDPSPPPSYRSNSSSNNGPPAGNSYRGGHPNQPPPPQGPPQGWRGPPPQQQQQGRGPPPQSYGPPQGQQGYGPPQGQQQGYGPPRPGYGPPQNGPGPGQGGYGPNAGSRQNSYGAGPGRGNGSQDQDQGRGSLFAGGRQNSGSQNPYAGTVPQQDPGRGPNGAGAYASGGGAGASGPTYGGAQNGGYGARGNGPQEDQQQGQGQQSQDLDEDEEIEGIKHMIKQTNQQSLASTRNALRTAREAEEVARATVEKLGEQSERFAATEQHLDMAKNYANRTEDNTKEIKALNRSIFRPNLTFNKQAKRDAADQRIIDRHISEKEEREGVLRDATRQRNLADGALGRRPGYGPQYGGEDSSRSGRRDYAQRSKYTFEADEEDQAVEDEIEDNVDEMTKIAQSLNGLAVAQGNILDEHNKKLVTLNDKADGLDVKLVRGTQKMKHI